MNPSLPWTPTLRETVAVTDNTRRRIMAMAAERHPDAPIRLAMWRVVSDALDALEREDAAARATPQPDAVALQAIEPAPPVTVHRIGEGYAIGREAEVAPIVPEAVDSTPAPLPCRIFDGYCRAHGRVIGPGPCPLAPEAGR